MKNTKFYIISILFIFILIEISSMGILDIIKKRSALSNFIKAPNSLKEIKEYSQLNKVGLINAGISSYSQVQWQVSYLY